MARAGTLPEGPDTAREGWGEEPPPLERSLSASDRIELEKDLVRKAPDLPWKEWAYYSGLKPWVGLGLFTIDAWIAAAWLEAGNYYGLVPSLALAVYLEILLYRYLWYRPPVRARRSKGRFRRLWWHPAGSGRWTPEAEQRRAGVPEDAYASETGPNPRDFL
jgi:hypothetical protein